MKFNEYIILAIVILSFVLCEKKNRKPIIIEHPTNSHGLSLQRVTLRCIAEGNPHPKIDWYKEGNVVESYIDKPVSSNRQVNGNELLFLHLDTQDEGIYQCNASNIEGWTMSNNASVRIAYLNKDIRGPEPRVASVGETVSLECQPPRGVPEPRVLWRFNGKMLEFNKRIKVMPNGVLRIDKATRSDSGRYSCIAKNFAYERESESAMLTVRQKPKFKVAPSNIEVRVNEAAVLSCSVDGDPRPSIVWRRDSDKHIASSRATLLEDRGLRITRVQLSDAGNYICQASNSAGTIEAVARLSVISAPGFLETPESQEARVGDTVKFACLITGSPRPTVIWVHNGRHFIAVDDDTDDRTRNSNKGEIVGSGERVRVNKEGSLVIGSVKVSDAGKYECRASSYTGTIQSSAMLTVIDSGHDRPPVIDIGPQNQTLRVGLTATFNCQTERLDEGVNIIWLKDTHRVNAISDPRVIQLTSGTLKINLLRASDAGNYTCRVERGRAYSTWSVTLRVLDKNDGETAILQTTDDSRMFPATPTNVEVIERGESSVTLKWDTPVMDPGETAINYYLVEYSAYESRRGWHNSITVTQSPAKISHLRPNTGYRILVRSVNDLAIGRPAVVPFIVFTNKKQSYSQLSYAELKSKIDNVFCDQVRLKSVNSDEVTVVWQVTGTVPALRLLTGFLALYRRVPLSRCLASNSKDMFMEHCSLGDHLLQQIDADINNPRSIHNEEGIEQSKSVPISDWNDRTAAYTIIGPLEPFVCYELYVRPYLDHPKFGRLTGGTSKTRTVLTYDSVPSKAPTDLTARWTSNTSVEITWTSVPPQYLHGILKGYSVHIIGNDTNSTRSIEVSPKNTVVRVQDLLLHIPYVVHIAASTCKGEGIRSAGLVLTATDNVITMSPNLYGARSGHDTEKGMLLVSVAKQPWFISIMVVGGCLWVMICVFLVVVCRGIYRRGLIYKSGYSNGTKLVSNSSSQVQPGLSNGRLQCTQLNNTFNDSTSTGLYKDTMILQPLMGTVSNSGDIGTDSKHDCADNVNNNSLSANNTNNNNQRRFHDSVSSNSSASKCSTNQQRVNNTSNISSNNVAPYASASLIQQAIGISTKNNMKNYNFPVNNPMTHRNILMPFSDPNLTSINHEMPSSQSYPSNAMEWALNLPNKSDKLGAGIMLNFGHVIPPPPQFPPPPAPISPTVSGNTYYLQQDPTADDGTCSYASCPIEVPMSGATTTVSPLPGYLWSAKHNSLVPVSGYIDYSCGPYNMIPPMTRHSDSGSMTSSFALPPPHDLLSTVHFSDELFSPGSNGASGVPNQLPIDGQSSMLSSHMSNGSSATAPHNNGSASSAIMSGGSSREYNSRSGLHDDSTSALEEEEEEEDDKCNGDCELDSVRCHKSTMSESQTSGWQSPRPMQQPSLVSNVHNFLQTTAPYYPYQPIEEATYDLCPDDQQQQSMNYYPPLHNHNNFFPAVDSNSYYHHPSLLTYSDPRTNFYDNPPHTTIAQPVSTMPVNPFLACGYLGETPIV